jgi:hypothetical protein
MANSIADRGWSNKEHEIFLGRWTRSLLKLSTYKFSKQSEQFPFEQPTILGTVAATALSGMGRDRDAPLQAPNGLALGRTNRNSAQVFAKPEIMCYPFSQSPSQTSPWPPPERETE